jgi:hypothetical protein
MARKVSQDAEGMKSKGMKAGKQAVGEMPKPMLDDGHHSSASGNDGSKAPAPAPEKKHKLLT